MLSLDASSWEIVQQATQHAVRLGIQPHQVNSASVLDFGVEAPGGLDAGLMLARICMSGLCSLRLENNVECPALPELHVQTDHPQEACIGSQYAGWEFKAGDFFAMTSGPARCLHPEPEAIITAAGIQETSDCAVGIMETRTLPDEQVVEQFAAKCGVEKDRVAICVAPTASFAGSIQVVARSIETSLHKLHELQFDLTRVVSAIGSAPVPLFGKDDFASLGWTNDCILYGARVTIWMEADDEELQQVGALMPSSASRDFGQPFLELFKKYDCDFYQVDKMLFSPAQVTFNNLKTGRSMTFGETRFDILCRSMHLDADG